MENIPDYDTWKGRSSEDDAEMRDRCSHDNKDDEPKWISALKTFVTPDENADAPVYVDKRDTLIKELVSALGHILFVSCQDGYRELVEYQDIENARNVLKKASEHGYVD
jgi:hypothetical protein